MPQACAELRPRRLKTTAAQAETSCVPTHRDKPEGFEEAARRRAREADRASEEARRQRAGKWRGRLAAQEEERKATSVPPPSRSS